ncbi:hypothetical protein Tco_0812635 [Tanacetum coccineum]
MRQRRWLELLSDYDCESKCSGRCIEQKGTSKAITGSGLSYDYRLDLPKWILEAQIEARKPENLKSEDVGGMLMRGGVGRGTRLNSKYDPEKPRKGECWNLVAEETLCI